MVETSLLEILVPVKQSYIFTGIVSRKLGKEKNKIILLEVLNGYFTMLILIIVCRKPKLETMLHYLHICQFSPEVL